MDSTIIALRPAEPPLTDTALCAWLGAAAPGDTIVYHRGALARELCPQLKLLEQDERVRLEKLAARAWRLAEAGLLHIVQRRHGFEDCSYLAIARHRPRRNTPSVMPLLLRDAA